MAIFEAEGLTLVNYQVEPRLNTRGVAGNQVIRIADFINPGTISTAFNEVSGTYNFRLGYYDESDGNSTLTFNKIVGGSPSALGNYVFTLNPGNDAANAGTFIDLDNPANPVIPNLQLAQGDTIQLRVRSGASAAGRELGRIDYFELALVNAAPVALADALSAREGRPTILNVLANDTDAEADPLTLVPGPITTTQGGTATINADGTITYTAATGVVGPDSFEYSITDAVNTNLPAKATVNITIVPNNAPVASGDSATTVQDTAVVVGVLANDTDADSDLLTVVAATNGSNGGTAVVNADGTITYTPVAGFVGADSFQYTITDGFDQATATVNVAVGATPIPPTTPVQPSTPEQPTTPGQPVVEGSNGTFTIQASTQLVFTATAGSTDVVKEVGFFLVDNAQGTIDGIAPDAANYAQAALNRTQVLFTLLADDPSGATPTRQISFENLSNVRFYEVQGGSTDAVRLGQTPLSNVSISDPTFDGVNALSFGSTTLTVKTTTAMSPFGTDLQGSPQGELFDLTQAAGKQVQASFAIASEATFNNTVGLYVVQDASGTVLDALTGNLIGPGAAGYAKAALGQRVFEAGRDTNSSVQLAGGAILAPFIVADGTVEAFLQGQATSAYFGFLGANSDNTDHVRLLGDNTIGFEDLSGLGDADFNDIVLNVQFSAVV